MGYDKVHVLDGGLRKWLAEGRPVEAGDVVPQPVTVAPRFEAELVRINPMMTDVYDYSQHERSAECTLEGIVALEVRIKRVHVAPELLMKGKKNRIDPDLTLNGLRLLASRNPAPTLSRDRTRLVEND